MGGTSEILLDKTSIGFRWRKVRRQLPQSVSLLLASIRQSLSSKRRLV